MNLVDRVKNLITAPNNEWTKISAETPDTKQIITGYVLPLAGLSALASFIGYGLIGFSGLGIHYAGINWGLYHAVTVLAGALISVYVTSLVVDALAPSFGSEKNFGRSLQLVAYSFTPAWVGGLLSVFPPLAIIGALFGLYSLYLMYLGIPKLKHTPADKQTGYLVVTIIITILVYMIVGWILGYILMSAFGLAYGY